MVPFSVIGFSINVGNHKECGNVIYTGIYHLYTQLAIQYIPSQLNCCGATGIKYSGYMCAEALRSLLDQLNKSLVFFEYNYYFPYSSPFNLLQIVERLNKQKDKKYTIHVEEIDKKTNEYLLILEK